MGHDEAHMHILGGELQLQDIWGACILTCFDSDPESLGSSTLHPGLFAAAKVYLRPSDRRSAARKDPRARPYCLECINPESRMFFF